MPSIIRSPNSGQVIYSLVIGSIAVLIIGVQPILLGALVDARKLTLDGVGLMAMGEIVTLGLGVILGGVLPLQRFRIIAICSSVVCAALDAATPLCANDMALIGVRALTGLAEGVLIWTSTCIIVRTAAPARVAGIFIVTQTLAQAGFAILLANFILPRGNWRGGFYALAMLSVVAGVLALSQPASLAPLRHGATVRLKWTITRAFPLVVAFLEQGAIGALWAYFDPLGQAIGLTPQYSQRIISMVLISQLAGGSLGTALIRRLSATAGLTLSCIALTAIALGIHYLSFGEWTQFTLLAALFGFVWVFSFPFQIGLAFNVDPAGHVATQVPAAQLLGSAIGPLIVSFIVTGDDAGPAAWISMVFGALATCLLLSNWRRVAQAPQAI